LASERKIQATTRCRKRMRRVRDHQRRAGIMTDCGQVRERVRELAARTWDVAVIEARYRKLLADGITRARLDLKAIITRTSEIPDRVQRKAEEYEYLGHN
jgi:hypothetical protein